ncbi:22138_t:CDS:2 [Cetraspora pellucida]|uniref:22138_t:CDS:1 n=2 Tax=Cetraspora pellucida TaxID=1433469 RepID=A0A9N9E4P3_9GLOM|nr:22138_t:CDS:2 [Cetraspora pellucida]
MTPDMAPSSSEEDPRLRKLTQELCSQLAVNREQVRRLQQQVDELKSRAERYEGPLNRSNYKGPTFEAGTDIERQNAQLIYENRQLNEENSELLSIIKEYETTLQIVMMKFRIQSCEIQRSKLDMQRDYEALLDEERATTSQVLSENVTLQSYISNISSLVREAYDAQTDLDTDILIESLKVENQGLKQMLNIANIDTETNLQNS